MKLVYLVLDGVADRPQDYTTSLEKAETPALDSIARSSKCGMMYTIGKGIAPESDAAVFSILGYDPHKEYTGRGPIEAVGAGLGLKEGYEVAFRANFATVDPATLRLIDRRCGRSLESEEAKELAAALDGMELGAYEGYARVVATVGHRAVVIIGSRKYRLSDQVSNTDPAYEKKGYISIAKKEFEPYIAEAKPLEDTEEARRTAELVNIFTRKAVEILDKHPVNEKRRREGKPPANAIIMRDSGGRLPRVKPIKELFGRSFGAVAEMPVEIGIARILGMDVANVPPPSEDKEKDYEERLTATLSLLEKNDVVYVHLKGPDEPGHDGDFDRKVRAIELIDKYFVTPLLDEINPEETAILVTADHATPWTVKAHTDDPVPVALMVYGVAPDKNIKQFSERRCARGSLGIIEHGWLLLPKVFSIIEEAEKSRGTGP